MNPPLPTIQSTKIKTIFTFMNLGSNQFLKWLCLFSGFVSGIGWLIYFIQFFREFEEHQGFEFFLQNPSSITYPLFCVFSIIIAVKANSNKGTLLFSLFLSSISLNIFISAIHRLNPDYDINLASTITFIITSAFYINSLQNFPQKITEEHIDAQFSRSKILRFYLKAFLKKQIWLFFSLIVLTLGLLLPGNLLMQTSVFLFVLLTALPFLYINFIISTPSGRNKITWLIWGILSYTFISVFSAILTRSNPDIHQYVGTAISFLRAFSLFISITMCLFFFDTFDTGVLIRRTIVDGTMFILIILLYNTIEHYLLHWINHKLHISNAIASSVLSGFFVLIFSPMHHKLMHFLDAKFKAKKMTVHGGHD